MTTAEGVAESRALCTLRCARQLTGIAVYFSMQHIMSLILVTSHRRSANSFHSSAYGRLTPRRLFGVSPSRLPLSDDVKQTTTLTDSPHPPTHHHLDIGCLRLGRKDHWPSKCESIDPSFNTVSSFIHHHNRSSKAKHATYKGFCPASFTQQSQRSDHGWPRQDQLHCHEGTVRQAVGEHHGHPCEGFPAPRCGAPEEDGAETTGCARHTDAACTIA